MEKIYYKNDKFYYSTSAAASACCVSKSYLHDLRNTRKITSINGLEYSYPPAFVENEHFVFIDKKRIGWDLDKIKPILAKKKRRIGKRKN